MYFSSSKINQYLFNSYDYKFPLKGFSSYLCQVKPVSCKTWKILINFCFPSFFLISRRSKSKDLNNLYHLKVQQYFCVINNFYPSKLGQNQLFSICVKLNLLFFPFFIIIFEGNQQKRLDKSFLILMGDFVLY